jgi:quinohemoprotein ethanol dehydrogenase
MRRVVLLSTGAAAVLAVAACTLMATSGAPQGPAAAVTEQRMRNAAVDTSPDAGQWMSHGRTWSEQRFSPLTQINDRNVKDLGLAWYADLGTYKGVVATPLVIDGVLYNITNMDVTTAYDATNGKVLWTYDPKIPQEQAAVACCGTYSRGLAAWNGKLFIGALNAHMIALDAKTGEKLWETDTADPGQPLSITGAPRVTRDGLVVIGNGGGDIGARGYISAYDSETGKQVWKFYIVPGDPSKPDGVASDSIMATLATRTWNGEWWKTGGGGNSWDAIVYDPDLDLVYIGTGNGSPHPQAFRTPGGGDNLFLGSILAVHGKTGEYAWHYQEVPGEQWDYDSTSPLILADLTIKGQQRKVIMHAPKDGFFYVIDRATGELLSAEPFVENTWASHVDLKTGRPAINPEAMVEVKPALVRPANAHNWNPMSYSPLTGLVYIPIQDTVMMVSRLPDGQFQFRLGRTTIGSGRGNYPELRADFMKQVNTSDEGYTLAWDPVAQKARFRIDNPYEFQGGNMVTAGNLLVQGTMNSTLAIYRADTGEKLWEHPTSSVPVAGPISYSVNGTQYIAVNAGWNQAIVHGLNNGPKPFSTGPAKLVVFKLGGKGELPPSVPTSALSAPPRQPQPADKVAQGEAVFAQFCSTCHGQNAIGSGTKDLRFIPAQAHTDFNEIVLGGKFKDKGMVPFNGVLTEEQVDAVHSYVIKRGQDDWVRPLGGPPPGPPPQQR